MQRASLWSVALVAALPLSLAGQTPGGRVQVSYTLPFSTQQQSMWGPADAPANIDFTIPLFDESWSESGTANGIFSAAGFQWGGSISGSTSGAVGLSFRIFGIGTGAVDLDYPVRVVLDLPEPNSFRDGDAVTIDSRFELLPGWKLATTPPGGALKVIGRFGTHLGASGKICLFGCPDPITLANFGVPTDPFELFSVSSTAGITLPAVLPPPFPQPLVIAELPYEFGAFPDLLGDVLGIAGPVDAPRVTTSATVGADRSLRASGVHRFVNLDVDLDHYLTFVGVPPLGFQSNPLLQLATGASFGYDVANMSLLLAISQQQTFTFLPRVTMTAHFPVSLEFAVLNADGSTAQSGAGTTVSFDVGQSLRVTTPAGARTPLPGTPTYGLANTFTSSSDFTFNERLVASAGRFSLHTPSRTVTTETVTYVCSVAGVFADVCEALGFILQAIVNTVTEVVPPADVDLGPLFVQTLVNETQISPLFPTGNRPGQWQLAGLQTFTEAPFVLDPEDPGIAVTTELASATLAVGGPSGAIVQTVTVRNEGDVSLSAAELRDAVAALLSGGTFQVLSVSSPTLVTDPAFDGSGNPALLAGGNSLPVGGEALVRVVMAVSPGSIYRANVRAAGRSPIGTDVAAEAAADLGVVEFEIIPDQVNAWSNGVLPTRIRSAGIGAGQIDLTTVRLEGIVPDQWNVTSNGDVILKFRLLAVLSALDQRLLAGVPIAGAAAAPGVTATLADLVTAVMNGAEKLENLRAFILAQRGGGGGGSGGFALPGLFASAQGAQRVLVVAGSLGNGTPFIGEDDLTVMHGGQ